MTKLLVKCECLTEQEEASLCEFCFGTGEVDVYTRDESTGYNWIVDGTKPCVCQLETNEE